MRKKLAGAAPGFFCWYARVAAVLSFLSWLYTGVGDWLDSNSFLGVLYAIGWFDSLPYALFMFLLSFGLQRRKRAAWRVLLAVFGLIFLPGVLYLIAYAADSSQRAELGADFPVGAFAASTTLVFLMGFWLIAARGQFSARSDRANRRLAFLVFLASLVVVTGLGWTVVAWTDSLHGAPWEHVLYAFLQTTLGSGLADLNVHVPMWVDVLLGFLGGGLLLLTAWVMFRPARRPAYLSPEEELPARRLLAEYGEADSLGYFAVRPDKDVVFSPNGKAGIAYRAIGPICLASGDPIGDQESWAGAIDVWLAECRAYSWAPGVIGASEKGAKAFHRAGLSALELGDEAILDLADFSLDGPEMRAVRQATRRVERAGYTTTIRRHCQIEPEEMAAIITKADQWREGETERGFSMALGRLGDPRDGQCVMVQAFDASGEMRGLLSFVPWGRTGLSLDLMRRDRAAENGLNEYMVAKLAEGAGTVGVRRLSLNFAMLRSIFERGSQIGAGPITRLSYRVLSFASKFWQLESLYLANAKYQPQWLPRYVCFGASGGGLIAIGIASARAEGFWPTLRKPKLLLDQPSPELVAQVRKIEAEAEAARAPRHRLSEQERVRHDKLAQLRSAGIEPYPLGFARTALAADLAVRFGDLPPDTRTGEKAALAGRVVLAREHGKICFATLRDESGDIQVMLTPASGGLAEWKALVDLGDLVGVSGEIITSRSGQLTLEAADWTMTAKCLRPLPDKRSGLTDPEARIRQRYVDLIVNDDARRMIRLRGDAVAAVRDELRERGFLEVETPMLQTVHGGAAARPFMTRMNAYNMRLYLRIAPELYLKRLLVGGMGKVFELNRNFRNEGVSPRHNPEFTMLEAYEPYGDYDTIGDLTRSLVISAATAALGSTVVVRDGVSYDLGDPWPAVTVYGSVSSAVGEEITTSTPVKTLQRLATAHAVPYNPEWGQGKLVQELFEALVEHTLMMPTFVRDYPAETSPLTRRHRSDPLLAEKWDLIAFGLELGTGYSELIDPIDQRERLTEQSLLAAGGDAEAMELDEDFLRALEYAMPPSGGMGMGIDRLLITLTGGTIRDTIAFPLVRPS